MSTQDAAEDQSKLLQRLVGLAPSGWKRIFVNYEMKDTDQGMVSDCIAFAVRKKLLGSVERINIETGANEWQIFNRLGRHFMGKSGTKALTLDIIIRNDGTFKTHIDYEPPIRLGGDLTAVKRHMRYVQEDEVLRQIV